MKTRIFFLMAAVVAVVASSFILIDTEESLAIGAKAPKSDLKMMGIDDAGHTLQSLSGENGLLVVFSCNTCPFVVGRGDKTEGWEGRYAGLKAKCDENKTGMVLINSNEAKRDAGDSMEDMKMRAKEQGFTDIPYVLDPSHVVADAFGARTTPHIFLFDSDMSLVYKGAIDDNVDDASAAKEHWLANAILANATGKEIDPNSTRPVGCSIKRVK